MQRILSWLGSWRAIVAICAAVLVPYFVLGIFAQPAADDFVYAARAMDLGFFESQKHWYLHWCGRYFATALQSGFPLACDMLVDYPLLPLTLLPATVVAIWLFLKQLAPVAGCPVSGRQVLSATLVLSAIYLTQMTSVCEGFYWFAGAATYQLPLVLLLLLVACGLSIRRGASRLRIVASAVICAVLALAIVGSNETLIPVLGLALLAAAAISFRTRHPSHAVWCAALAAAVAGATLVVMAPGNAGRAACFPDRPPTLTCLALGVWGTIRHVLKWSVRPVLLGSSVLLVPLAADLLSRTGWAGRIRGKHVLAAGGLLFAVLFLAFLPAYLGMGLKPPPRALNILFFLFLVGWFAVLALTVAWRQNKKSLHDSDSLGPTGESLPQFQSRTGFLARPRRLRKAVLRQLFLGRSFPSTLPAWWGDGSLRRLRAVGAAVLLAGLLAVGSFPRAVYDLACLAPSYRQELQERYAQFAHETQQAEATPVEPLRARPKSICFSDVGEDPTQTPSYARYFGLSSVALRPAPARR